jgi:hypothetical protein
MNDVYGIDPEAPENYQEFASLMRLFEPGAGRFIIDFPMGWMDAVRSHLSTLSSLEHLKFIEILSSRCAASVVPTPTRISRYPSWIESAYDLQSHVKALVSKRGCPPVAEPIDKMLERPDGFPDARGGHIQRTGMAYAQAARPLLQTSPKIVLVDPYFKIRYLDRNTNSFRPSTRHIDSLKWLLKESAKWRRVEVFRLMVSTDEALKGDPNGELFKQGLDQIARDAGASLIRLEHGLLEASISTDRHARYLLGMKQGLHFDRGFDTGDPHTTNHVEWMGQSVLKPLLDRFV